MARRFETYYKTKRLDNLGDPEWHNRRWEDIDRRMHTREIDATKIDDAVDRVESIALSRLNDTFSPIIQQAMNQLADVGVSFTGQSLTQHTIDTNPKIFTITNEFRVALVVVDYVSIRPTGVSATAMICSVTSYNRQTGALEVVPIEGYITGSGTYSDWQIKVSVTPNLDTYTREEVDGQIELATELIMGVPPENLNTLEKISYAIDGINQTLGGTAGANLVLMRTNNLSDLSSASTARANIGLGNVNNTSDLNKPVSNATQAAINTVVAAVFPVGTTMVFIQAIVPVGWIRSTAHNDKAMRVVSGTGGGVGGNIAFSTVFSRVNVDYTTLDTNTLPSHAHSVYDPSHVHGLGDPGHAHGVADPTHSHTGGVGAFHQPAGSNLESYDFSNMQDTGYAYTGIGIYGAGTGMWVGYGGTGIGIYAAGASWGHTHGIDLRCQYVDVLIGVKA